MLDKYITDYVDNNIINSLTEKIDKFVKINKKSSIYAEELVANDMGDGTNITKIDPSYTGQKEGKSAPEVSLNNMVPSDDTYINKTTPSTRNIKEVAKTDHKGLAKDDASYATDTKREKKKNKSIKLKYKDKYILFNKM